MHNCKANRETLIALALNGLDQNQSLPAELETCATCREEYAALRKILHATEQAKESALPGESFWPGYHARLRQHLEDGTKSAVPSAATAAPTSLRTRFGALFASSVRVPIPLAASLLVLLGVSIVFALSSRRPLNAPPPIIVTKTVEVPVTEEKIRDNVLTRVVYRDRGSRQLLNAKSSSTASPRIKSGAAAPISLVGFKPANDVKLTIIKGSYRDEK